MVLDGSAVKCPRTNTSFVQNWLNLNHCLLFVRSIRLTISYIMILILSTNVTFNKFIVYYLQLTSNLQAFLSEYIFLTVALEFVIRIIIDHISFIFLKPDFMSCYLQHQCSQLLLLSMFPTFLRFILNLWSN